MKPHLQRICRSCHAPFVTHKRNRWLCTPECQDDRARHHKNECTAAWRKTQRGKESAHRTYKRTPRVRRHSFQAAIVAPRVWRQLCDQARRMAPP